MEAYNYQSCSKVLSSKYISGQPACECHLAYRTIKWVSDEPHALMCSVCQSVDDQLPMHASVLSRGHVWLLQFLRQAYPNEMVATEAVPVLSPMGTRVHERQHALGELSEAEYSQLRSNASHVKVDAWMPTLGLIIMYDGEQHTESAMHGNDLGEQEVIDWLYAVEVLKAGKRMLRIHHADFRPANGSPKIKAAVAQAVKLCQEQPAGSWVMFSRSFKRSMAMVSDVPRILQMCA
jgi:hypothetical protein